MPLQHPRYELTFTGFVTGYERATLTSPLLDPLMHEKGVLNVDFLVGYPPSARRPRNAAAATPAIDLFQLASLAYYLTNQQAIRAELQRALHEHVAGADLEDEIGRGPALWKNVTVAGIDFHHRRLLQTHDEFERELEKPLSWTRKKPSKSLVDKAWAHRQRTADTPETQASFTIYLAANWPDDHDRCLRFRDGKCIDIEIHG